MVMRLGKKEKIELLVTMIGIGCIILILAGNYQKPKPTKSNSVSMPGHKAKVIKYKDIKWGIDPFYPTETNAGSYGIGGLILTGIMWDKDNPLAIINDNVVKTGDKLNEFTVTEINKKNVALEKDGDAYTLELRE